MPLLSVIIPNYNHAKFLEKRIQSVLLQSFKDFEVIILDDCSADDSKAVIERYRNEPKISHIIYNDLNSGTTFKQWDKGIKLATGIYIWIAESDDYASPDFLTNLIKPLITDENVVLSFCRSVNVDENGNHMGLTLHADELDKNKWNSDYIESGVKEIANFLQYRNTIPNASAVVFKKPENLANLLSLNMKFCGDWLFWQNLLKQPAAKIAYNARPLNYFRTHSSTTRFLKKSVDLKNELQRFKEYKSFVPKSFINPFDDRFRWMMAEWIDRGLYESLKGSKYRYIPELHPTLIARYYMYAVKRMLKKIKFIL